MDEDHDEGVANGPIILPMSCIALFAFLTFREFLLARVENQLRGLFCVRKCIVDQIPLAGTNQDPNT